MKTQEKETVIARSYLTFTLGEEEYGAHVNNVLNIIEATRITSVPNSPSYMEGVINLRGTVLPVIDLKKKLSMPAGESQGKATIVVLEVNTRGNSMDEIFYVGAIVDQVVAVHEIEELQIQPPPRIGNQYQSQFIRGMVQLDQRFIMLLDVEKLFNEEEKVNIQDSSYQPENI